MAVGLSPRNSGWERDDANSRTNIRFRGTRIGHITGTTFVLATGVGLTITNTGLTVTAGGVTVTAGGVRVTAGRIVENLSLTDITTAGAETYTAAQLATGVITRDPAGAARTDTTDTAANIIAGTPALSANGDCLACWLINTADAAEAITLAGGTGVTVSNVGQTLAQNESALLLFRRTSASAVTLYIIGA